MIASAVIIAISPAAGADGIGVLAVSGADRSGGGGAVTAAAMTTAVGARSPRIVGDAIGEARRAIAAGAVPLEALARFRRVRELVDEGWRAYLRVSVELAASRLALARTEAEALLGMPGGPELYADAALRLGAVLGHLGRTAEARQVLALAITLDPERPITLAEFSPDIVDAVTAARGRASAAHPVRIDTEPSGAVVAIDGRDIGRTPIEVELPEGQHVVVARSGLHEPATRGLMVTGATTATLELARDDDAIRLAAGAELGLDELTGQRLVDAIVRYADLEEIVIVANTFRRGQPALLVQRCAGLPVRCSAVAEVGYTERAGLSAAADAGWRAVVAAELRYPPTVLGERDGASEDRTCKVCRSPWLWTGVGAAVIIGTAVTWAIVSASKPAPIVGIDGTQWR